MEMPNVTKKRVKDYLKEGKRFDGRSQFEFRDLTIETGVSKKAEGSARVKLGDTEVLAGVKLGLGAPYPDSGDKGNLMVTAELSPMASELFEKGPPSIAAISLARVIDRGIRESEVIDLKKLCIKENELVWTLFLDLYPINDAGNLVDASALALMAALKTTVFPELIDNERIDYGNFTTKKLPLKDAYPLTLTFHKVGEKFLLDPTTGEESASDARMTISLSTGKKGEAIHAMQKEGDSTFSLEDIKLIGEAAPKEIKKLFTAFEKAIK